MEKAREVGAYKVIDARETNAVDFLKALPGGGVDHVFETAGSAFTTLQTGKVLKKGDDPKFFTPISLAGVEAMTENVAKAMKEFALLG